VVLAALVALVALTPARSHGRVRVANDLVRWMARTLRPSTPVTIR
jgi:lipoprotein-anchoring transpeptidase ErfK/SrfK